MAIGPFARILAQVIVPVIAVLARALPAAYAQALQNAKKAGVDQAAPTLRKTLSKQEALQILNMQEGDITAQALKERYEKYMAANDVAKGGSFYLQSKVYRANELLDQYIEEKEAEKTKDKSKSQQD